MTRHLEVSRHERESSGFGLSIYVLPNGLHLELFGQALRIRLRFEAGRTG